MGKPQNVKNEGYVTLTTFPFELASTRQSASNRWLLIGHADTGWAESKASSTQNHRNCCEGRISCRTWWPHSLSVQRVAASAADNDGRQSVKVDNRLTTGPRYTSINKPLSWAHITWHILPTVPKLVPSRPTQWTDLAVLSVRRDVVLGNTTKNQTTRRIQSFIGCSLV